MTEEQRLAKRRRQKRAQRRRTIRTIILVILLITSMLVAGIFGFLYQKEKGNAAAAREEANQAKQEADSANESYQNLLSDLENNGYITIGEANVMVEEAVEENSEDYLSRIRGYMESGDGTLTMLENLFTDMIVVPDTGKYSFFDIDDSLNKSVVDLNKLICPTLNEETNQYEGDVEYEDSDVTLHIGVDVSKFQGDVDWEKVKNDNIEYAYIRLGYRGYESGKIVVDDKYEDNIKACNDASIDCGVYFFTEAKTREEGIEEAEFVLENLSDYHVELPIVIDVEQSANMGKSRTKNLTKEERTEAVIGFCERIKEAGYTPMIYGNLKSMMIMLEYDKLEEYDKWFAYYHYPLRFPYKIKMWQYSSTGNVDGIKGDADLNVMFY